MDLVEELVDVLEVELALEGVPCCAVRLLLEEEQQKVRLQCRARFHMALVGSLEAPLL